MPPRVIVSGLLRDGLGLAEATRGYAVALAAGGCEVLQHFVRLPGRPFPHGDPGPGGALDLPEAASDAEADLVLVCLCPPELETLRAARQVLPAGRLNAGLWIWDVDPLPPAWGASVHRFDEIWSPASYVTGLLERAVTTPVFTAPPAMRRPVPGGGCQYLDPERPTVVALADVASSLERKNPAGAIEAFKRAFAPGEGPRLVVKIWNGNADPAGRARLAALADQRDDIVIADQWLSRPELVSLLEGAACFLSLHRAEGFGLPIFEALHLGTPVIATAFSGPMDVLDETVAGLVPWVGAEVPDGIPAYPAGSLWAEPDLDVAAAELRSLWQHPEEAQQRAERGRHLVAERLGPEATGRAVAAHLVERLAAAGSRQPRAPLRPWLSVVTPLPVTTAGASTLDRLRRLGQVVRQAGGEVLVGVAQAATVPDGERPPGVRVVTAGRGSEPALRAAALAAADGDFVAVVGEGALPHPHWWASYEQGFEASGAEVLFGPPVRGAPSPLNCAFRRDLLDGLPVSPGWLERRLLAGANQSGSSAYVAGAELDMEKSRRLVRSYAQMAEDVRLDRAFRGQAYGLYVDIGAGHPVVDSVTKHFYDLGWSGIDVEPDVRSAGALRRDRPRDVVIEAACSDHRGEMGLYETGFGEGWSTVEESAAATVRALLQAGLRRRRVPCIPLSEVFAEHVNGPIDFLKIDAEGHESAVIGGNDWRRWRPRVVVIEATEPHSIVPSHATWEPSLLRADYLLAGFDGINRFYVAAEEAFLAEVLAEPITALDDFETHRHMAALEELAEARHEIAVLAASVGRLEAQVAELRPGGPVLAGSPLLRFTGRAAKVARQVWSNRPGRRR